jgi:spermidine/putrescine transport system permease protein
MRFGLSPMINVIGVIFVVITVVAATAWVLARRRSGNG